MKKVLIIANQFPPMAGSGIQRTLKFVKYLPDFDYLPVVLTRKTSDNTLTDSSFLKDIPSCAHIIRTKACALGEVKGLKQYPAKFISRKMLIPDDARIWADLALKTAVQVIRSEKIELIYTTSAPYSDHLLGLRLKRKFPSLKWLCDFRDEWSRNPYLLDKPHHFIRTKIEKGMETEVIRESDIIIANTPLMMENFIEIYPFCKNKIDFIPNGFDSSDFLSANNHYSKNKKFTITYTGLLYGRRSAHTFLEALEKLCLDKKIDNAMIQIQFIGNFKEKWIDSVQANPVFGSSVCFKPYMDHAECIGYQMRSDCVLLIEGSGGGAEAFYTGKVFEYLKVHRPIIAVIPSKGVAARLIRETNTGQIADFDDTVQIANVIEYFYKQWLAGDILYEPVKTEIGKYERRTLTQKLASKFDSLLES